MAHQFVDPKDYTRKQNVQETYTVSRVPGVIQDPHFNNTSNRVQYQNFAVPAQQQSNYKREVLVEAERPGYQQTVQTRSQVPPSRKAQQYRSCPIALLGLLGLLAITGIVLGVLFGFGIIGGKRGAFEDHVATRYTNVDGVNYQPDSVQIEKATQIQQPKWQATNETFDAKGKTGQPVNITEVTLSTLIPQLIATNQTFDTAGKTGQAIDITQTAKHENYLTHVQSTQVNHESKRQLTHVTRVDTSVV